MKIMSTFANEVIARIKGDDAKALAAKNERKAVTATKSQIAALETAKIDAEDSVESAQKALADAKYPSKEITDRKGYISTINFKRSNLKDAEEALSDIEEELDFWRKHLKEEFSSK